MFTNLVLCFYGDMELKLLRIFCMSKIDWSEFDRNDYITEDELTEAIYILRDFVNEHHKKDVSKNVRGAVKYLEKALADDELVMVYYP